MKTNYVIRTAETIFQADHAQTDPTELNNRSRGDTATFDFYVDDSELVVQSGETYTVDSGETEVYNGADIDGTLVIGGELIVYGTVDNDGTIDNNGTFTQLSGALDTLNELLEYDRHAGSYSLSTTLDNTQRYKERLPTNANVSSLVVGIEPATDLENRDIAGKWGIISNVTDNRTRALTNPVVSIEVDILADYSEYSDLTAVQNDLEI